VIYKVVKDQNNKIVCWGPNMEEYSPTIRADFNIVLMTWEELQSAQTITAQEKAKELAGLAIQYKADVTSLQLVWLSAAVFDGVTEDGKKEQVQMDLADIKSTYLLDVAAVKAKYI